VERQRVLELWNDFSGRVISRQAGAVQRHEMQMAFFGGASALFALIIGSLEPGTEATTKDLEVMSEIQRELERYAERMRHAR